MGQVYLIEVRGSWTVVEEIDFINIHQMCDARTSTVHGGEHVGHAFSNFMPLQKTGQ